MLKITIRRPEQYTSKATDSLTVRTRFEHRL